MARCEETAAGPVYKGGRAEALTQQAHTALPTVTVRGFLNFRTTVDGTVIVFTPASDGKPTATSTARPSSSTNAVAPQPQIDDSVDLGMSYFFATSVFGRPLLFSKNTALIAKKLLGCTMTRYEFGKQEGGSVASAALFKKSHETSVKDKTTNVLGFEIVGGGANEVLPPPTPTSRQPTSTSTNSRRRLSNTRISSRSSSSRPQYPTGLVTVLGGTHVHR
ncbi:hypothetical protein HPB51_022202 [Rhipicephalus microplus]|uniref:Uncharacterized protein n=1 Tax=Rhipicephalus microplus TaxID=6941 RepID=A0A9J6DXV9_RHIMP|nr:hypothetical protein HPB51_022202 [Rhipicephalus microplus]